YMLEIQRLEEERKSLRSEKVSGARENSRIAFVSGAPRRNFRDEAAASAVSLRDGAGCSQDALLPGTGGTARSRRGAQGGASRKVAPRIATASAAPGTCLDLCFLASTSGSVDGESSS